MMNKKGFIRTLEALISILLLLGFILYLFSGKSTNIETTPEIVESANNNIINEFLYNPTFRTCFSNTNNYGLCSNVLVDVDNIKCKEEINNFIVKSVPIGYSHDCEICNTAKSCSNIRAPKEKSVYPNSGFIYSEKNKEGRIVRIYIYPI